MNSNASAVEHAPSPGTARAFLRRLALGDAIAHIVTLIFAASIILITSLLVYQLWVNSAASRRTFGWHFWTTSVWDPVFEHFGALPFLYGTVITSLVALVLAVPLGVGAAIFLAELAPPRISDMLAFLIDLLAAVPSVIYGLLGIFVVVPFVRTQLAPFLETTLGYLPFFRGPSYGLGVLTASLVLAMMIVPFIISVSREVLLAVPRDQREAALALGATRWESTIRVVVHYARSGITGSIFLAMARALGETMAVTMVIGNEPKIFTSLLAPGYTIAAVIANEFSEATGTLYLEALIELGLVLFLVTFILNGLARLLILATEQRGGTHA
ncbi:MAG TPA: phosphate ABC transporter permease subunit PstC [Candidatus Acidoferrales bacterium]|nr:phosphate ABC transporter permease subunit PstC [Candidatus Acidoferrales bacterium]